METVTSNDKKKKQSSKQKKSGGEQNSAAENLNMLEQQVDKVSKVVETLTNKSKDTKSKQNNELY